jgi:hypothetical protein
MGLYFEEKQMFTQWWLWLVVGATTIGVNAAFVYAVIQQLVMGVPVGDKPLGDEALLIMSVLVMTASTGMALLFFNSVLEVRVDNRSLEYRYPPIMRTWRRIEHSDIRDARLRKYYLAGYGIKRSLDGTRMLTVKGTDGVELSLESGTRLLIGTQRPEEFLAAVRRMAHPKEM